MSFKAILLEETGGKVKGEVRSLEDSVLPPGDVTVRVEYSTLNYKDGLVLCGLGKLVKQYPHVPGIDFSGTVESSASPRFKPGDKVILTGWRVGELHWGGYAQRARVMSEWLVPLPHGLTTLQAMGIGTAGLTAMLAVMALEEHGIMPDKGDVIVTGAAGGLGSIAVALLAKLDYSVVASTGRAEARDYLKFLGAEVVIPRDELSGKPVRPLLSERWAGGVDTVGGNTLANLLSQIKYRGSVASCGLAGGSDLPATVIPFIIRGVNLLGIDSVLCPRERRMIAWQRLARDLPLAKLDTMVERVPLVAALTLGPQILKGQVRGRTVIDVNA
ncbi:MAG TPA: MDR family oxidoreductase [Alphaproteobacteria bacterium]|nr:MDR family oxidoreductase [Alphaproteobacteria bacterium]